MRRRGFLAGLSAAAVVPRTGWGETETEDLEAIARRLSRLPHRKTAMRLVPPFDALTYDSFRAIRPLEGGAAGLMLGDGFSADLLPPGFFFRDAVSVEIEKAKGFHEIGFDPALFRYAERYFDGPPRLTEAEREGMGFSGIRLRAPFRQAGIEDEFFVAQGASYFRAVSRQTRYGLSARAVAIGTGGAGPEEFPVFTRLRLHRAEAGRVRIDALIESPSVTGAAMLTIVPGEPTVTDVELVLFPRVRIEDIGIAPLTSMYLKGPLRSAVSDDFRPRVHDSDALGIANGAGERLWRPLSNPATLQTSGFEDTAPRGFGLIQSVRGFSDYEDPEAAYHLRPSAWVEPGDGWGRGAVMLVEIPTRDEFLDNIVAFWRPSEALEAGGVYRYAYRIKTGADPLPSPGARATVAQSRSGRVHDRPGALQYIVDFDGGGFGGLTPHVTASHGQIQGVSAYEIPERGHLRVGFRFEPGAAHVSELRLFLRDHDGDARSHVWLHRWTPARDGGP